MVHPHMLWSRVLVEFLQSGPTAACQTSLSEALQACPAVPHLLLGCYKDPVQAPYFTLLLGERRSVGSIDHAEEYVMEFGSFWTEEALTWLSGYLKLSAQFVAPTPPAASPAPSPQELQEYTRRLITLSRCALVRGAIAVALESTEMLVDFWRKHRPQIQQSWRGSQPHLVVEIPVLRSRALLLGDQPAEALSFLENDPISELLGAHVHSALSAEYCPGQDREFAHLYARRSQQACSVQLKKDRANDLADSTSYVANHTCQRLQNARFRRRSLHAGVLLDLAADLPITDVPLSTSTVEVAALLKNQELFSKETSLVRIMYALPQGWIERAALFSPVDLCVFINELYLNNFFETSQERIKEVHGLAGKAFDTYMNSRLKAATVEGPTEDLTDVATLAEDEGDELDTLFGGAEDEDGSGVGVGVGVGAGVGGSGKAFKDIYGELPEAESAAVPGTHLIRASKKVMKVVFKRHGGETLAIAGKAVAELWSSYCKLLVRK